jgi:hypothetical protein
MSSCALQQAISSLRRAWDPEEAGVAVGRRFTVTTLDGREVELKRNGAALTVTPATTAEYCHLLEKYKLSEFDVQVWCTPMFWARPPVLSTAAASLSLSGVALSVVAWECAACWVAGGCHSTGPAGHRTGARHSSAHRPGAGCSGGWAP